MSATESLETDVVVLGGGPGGATAATLIARAGHRVVLLERESFPRHQVGESLLPATVHYICALLGVREELEAAGFVKKHGGAFLWGKSQEPWTFSFGISPELTGANAFAYQVRRAEFDQILLDNARRKGVDVREQHTALEVLEESGRVAGVRYRDSTGGEHIARARYVIDACGYASPHVSRVGERIYSKFFQNIALYAYFEGGQRLPAPNEGSILSVAFDQGWFWYIPLGPNLTSVGAVIAKEHADRLKQAPEAALAELIQNCPMIRDYLADAKRVEHGMYGSVRIRKDWSYCHDHFWVPGLVLVGDSACFVDPVFSSGVHLATYAGLLAARSINTCLGQVTRGEAPSEARCFEEFELRYRREFGNFYQFLVSFYDRHKDEQSYFWEARAILRSEEAANEAFVRLVSGVSTTREPIYQGIDEVFGARQASWRARERLLEAVRTPSNETPAEIDQMKLEVADHVSAMLYPPEARARTLDVFKAGLESSRQLFVDGLIPSDDELSWEEA